MPEPELSKPSFTVPRTTYLWIALLVASLVLGAWLPVKKQTKLAAVHEEVTGPNFSRFLAAEEATRTAFAFTETVAERNKALVRAADEYTRLAHDTQAPNPTRKTLIVNHALGRPLTESQLKDLTADLAATGKASEAPAECALWRSLYGTPPTAPLPADAETRLKAMQLRFLDNAVLADLYTKQNKEQQAARALSALRTEANGIVRKQRIRANILGLTFVAGIVLLPFFLIAALTKKWHWVGRVATKTVGLTWGELLDGFAFYLMLYNCLGEAFARLNTFLHVPMNTGLVALMQAVTGLGAMLYLGMQARRRGRTLAEVGLTGKNLVGDVFYGLAGYAAMLPIVAGLGFFADKLFKDNSDTTPNPVLPLLAGSGTALDRLMIYTMVAIMAPLFEEFFFRGTLFTALRLRYGWVLSGILSAVVFALMHPIQDWIPIVGLGFSFAILREMRQSLVPGIVAHACQNTLAYLTIALLFGTR